MHISVLIYTHACQEIGRRIGCLGVSSPSENTGERSQLPSHPHLAATAGSWKQRPRPGICQPDEAVASFLLSVAPRMKSDSSVALGGPPASNFTSGSSHKLSAAGMSSFLLRPHTRGPAPSDPSSWSSPPHLVMLPSSSPHQHPALFPERLS